MVAHPAFTFQPGDHGLPLEDWVENFRVVGVHQEVGAEVEETSSPSLGEWLEEEGLELTGERGDARALCLMEQMIEDRTGIAFPRRNLHDLGETSSLQIRDIPSEYAPLPVTDKTLYQIPSTPYRCHLLEQPCQELLIVVRIKTPMLGDGR
jgi:hypothetical protein